jgi:putative ABC transport system substrate-binding protein
MPELAAELLAWKPDVLVGGVVPTLTFVRVTHDVPIVFAGITDPVELGLIGSYARPGGNATGTSRTAGPSHGVKHLELLRMLVPGLARVALTFAPLDPAEANNMQAAAARLGIDAQPVPIAATADVEDALTAALAGRPQALVNASVIPDHQPLVFAFATRHGLPSAGGDPAAGCLLNYAADLPAMWYRAGSYHVDRILRGAKPADLPVEGPAVFRLVVSRTTARALGLAVPVEFADQVAEWVD